MPINNASAWWKFDGGYTDASGNGNTLSAVGAPDFTAGQVGQALRSPNTGAYAQKSGLVISSGSFSMGGWFYIPNSLQVGLLIQFGDGNSQWLFKFSGSIRFRIDDGTDQISSVSSLTFPNWFHVVGTYNASTGEYILYVNGAAENSATGTAAFPASSQATGVFADGSGSGAGSNALADEVFFFPAALTPAEVLQIYNNGLGDLSYPFAIPNVGKVVRGNPPARIVRGSPPPRVVRGRC